jgi:RNA polymerase sigma-70 factor (ECF subfamily)
LSDEDLVKAVQAGNPLAMNVLVARFQAPLFKWLRWKTGNYEDAFELSQEVWLLVWRKIKLFCPDSGRPIFPWLFCVARNLFNSFYRRKAAHPRVLCVEDPGAIGEEPARKADPGRDLQVAELREKLERLVVTLLPVEKQEVIRLWFFDELPGPKIAQLLGIEINTVYSRMHDALKILRRMSVHLSSEF